MGSKGAEASPWEEKIFRVLNVSTYLLRSLLNNYWLSMYCSLYPTHVSSNAVLPSLYLVEDLTESRFAVAEKGSDQGFPLKYNVGVFWIQGNWYGLSWPYGEIDQKEIWAQKSPPSGGYMLGIRTQLGLVKWSRRCSGDGRVIDLPHSPVRCWSLENNS